MGIINIDETIRLNIIRRLDNLIDMVGLPLHGFILGYFNRDDELNDESSLNIPLEFLEVLFYVKSYISVCNKINTDGDIKLAIMKLEAINDLYFDHTDMYDKFEAYHFNVVIGMLKEIFVIRQNTLIEEYELKYSHFEKKYNDVFKNFTGFSSVFFIANNIHESATKSQKQVLLEKLSVTIKRIRDSKQYRDYFVKCL